MRSICRVVPLVILPLQVACQPETGASGPAGAEARAAAVASYYRGLDAYARLDTEAGFAAMQAAWEADPWYLPAFLEAARFSAWGVALTDSQWRVVEGVADGGGPLAPCVRVILDFAMQKPEPPIHGARACPDLGRLFGRYPPIAAAEQAEIALGLLRAFPESLTAFTLFFVSVTEAGDWSGLETAAEILERQRPHPFRDALASSVQIELLHARGEHARARNVELELWNDVGRLPPGVLELVRSYTGHLAPLAQDDPLIAHRDSVELWRNELARLNLSRADPPTRLPMLSVLGTFLVSQGRLREAVGVWSELAEVAEALHMDGWRARALLGRGRTEVKLGDLAEAEADLLEARRLARGARSLEPAYEVEHNLLHLYESTGQDSLARAAGEAFVRITREARLLPVRMMSYRDLATYLRRKGEQEASLPLFDAMVATIDSLGDYHYYAGEYFEITGELDRARSYYARQLPESQDRMRALEGLVRIAEATGDTAGAIRQARAYDGRVRQDYPEYRPLLPGVLARAGRSLQAHSAFEEARAAAEGRGQRAAWARLTLEQAQWEADHGSHRAAAERADSAWRSADAVADFETEVRARALSALEWLRVDPDHPREHLEALDRVGAEAEATGDPQLRFEVGLVRGLAHASLGDRMSALTALRQASDLAASVGGGLESDVERAGYGAARSRASDAAFSLLLSDPTRTSPNEWLEWSIRRKVYAGEGASPFPAVDAIAHRLGPDRAVVDYVVTADRVGALVLTDDTAVVMSLSMDSEEIAGLALGLNQGVAPRVGTRLDVSRSRFDEGAAHELYLGLIRPLEAVFGDRERLTIVPDGPLHVVPFDALVSDGALPVEFLVERYEIALARSATVTAPPPIFANGELLAIGGWGPSAAGVARELQAVTGGWGEGGSTILVGPASTEERVRTVAPAHTLIHFAAHARPNDANPDLAYVALQDGPGRESRLYARDIPSLSLAPGALVVLSACETASGRILTGEGVMSLARAFLRAGASGVVGTLWTIGTPAAPLMQSFYGALARGTSPQAALRKARLHLLRSGGPEADPLYWAPFVLVTPGISAVSPGDLSRFGGFSDS